MSKGVEHLPPEKLFFRIGEVCEIINVQPHVLRYWESEFPQLTPQKNPAGQRVYRRKDVEMVMRIHNLLYEEKFTIAGAKKRLAEEIRGSAARLKANSRPAPPPPAPAPAEPEDFAAAAPIAAAPVAAPAPPAAPEPPPQALSPQARRTLRVIRRDLEYLLTLLSADVRINC